MRPLRLFSALSAFCLPLCPAINAQQQQPAFDVTVVHLAAPSADGRSHIVSDPHDAHFRAVNVPLNMLLQFAFDIPGTRILGGGEKLRHTFFDIQASSDSAADAQQKSLDTEGAKARKRAMLQALLRDRFHLIAHTETRDLPAYFLVIVKGGPRLTPSKTDGRYFNTRNAEIQGTGYTSEELARDFGYATGREVLDHTGLTGRYDIDLKWSNGDDPTSTLPSLSTAVEEQLGLKLESTHAPIQVLVIDRLDPPTDN